MHSSAKKIGNHEVIHRRYQCNMRISEQQLLFLERGDTSFSNARETVIMQQGGKSYLHSRLKCRNTHRNVSGDERYESDVSARNRHVQGSCEMNQDI
jgi:hypothetical protein